MLVMSTVYLGLGTNLGDRVDNLRQAIRGLGEKMNVIWRSPVYETEAWGVEDQPDFLNMCIGGFADLSPQELLHFVKALERRLGRVPSVRWGPRLIDIDILFYNHLVLNTPSLSIPHVGIAQRASVLVPLADIVPDFEHPILKKSIRELKGLVDTSGVRYFETLKIE